MVSAEWCSDFCTHCQSTSIFGLDHIHSPIDGKNLNRVFPGKPNGTITERIAYFLVHNIYHLADYVIDMHSGDATMSNLGHRTW